MMKRTLLATLFVASLGAVATPARAASRSRSCRSHRRRRAMKSRPRRAAAMSGRLATGTGAAIATSGCPEWVRERPGYSYSHAHWAERDGGWHMERRNWSSAVTATATSPTAATAIMTATAWRTGNDRSPDNPRRNLMLAGARFAA